jgi:hypothetical protein
MQGKKSQLDKRVEELIAQGKPTYVRAVANWEPIWFDGKHYYCRFNEKSRFETKPEINVNLNKKGRQIVLWTPKSEEVALEHILHDGYLPISIHSFEAPVRLYNALESEIDPAGLADLFLQQVVVQRTEYIPIFENSPDAATLQLAIPRELLLKYARQRNQNQKIPDIKIFLRETGLLRKLASSEIHQDQSTDIDLCEIVEYLGKENISAKITSLKTNKLIRIEIEEIPIPY